MNLIMVHSRHTNGSPATVALLVSADDYADYDSWATAAAGAEVDALPAEDHEADRVTKVPEPQYALCRRPSGAVGVWLNTRAITSAEDYTRTVMLANTERDKLLAKGHVALASLPQEPKPPARYVQDDVAERLAQRDAELREWLDGKLADAHREQREREDALTDLLRRKGIN